MAEYKPYKGAFTGEKIDSLLQKVDSNSTLWDNKQEKIIGQSGQIVSIDESGNAVAKDAPALNVTAETVGFDNTDSGLTSTNVQDAVEEVNSNVVSAETVANNALTTAESALAGVEAAENTIGDLSALTTTDKTSLVAAINEINGKTPNEKVSSILNDNTWETIHSVSAIGANYWSVGDRKSITINGTVGTQAISGTFWVYILGFNHNSLIEGVGIQFGGFKTAQSGGVDICLVDSSYNQLSFDGTKYFQINHWGNSSSPYNTNYGGWAACDMRYDILGSTDKAPIPYGSTKTTDATGRNPSSTCTTNPVANTLMAALPADLRAVMQPMTKYTDNVGNKSNVVENVTATVDYLPLLAEFEIFGTQTGANQYEQSSQAQYDYYKAGNSKAKYQHSATSTAVVWWERSPYCNNALSFNIVNTSGSDTGAYQGTRYSQGVAPVFRV